MASVNTPVLVMGSKNYSSWSLRPWVFLRKVGFEFREQIVHFDTPNYQAEIAALSPSRRVPVLIDGETAIWDSLAICEYAADCTGRGLPKDRMARALARSAAAEMHSGFAALREQCPMNVRAAPRRVPSTPQLEADIARVDQIWSQCRQRYGGDGSDVDGKRSAGGWLFGDFSIADAMFAPVWFRFRTYGASLCAASQAYLRRALADPQVAAWQEEASKEGHPLREVDAVGGSP